jgi:hypothetical protein
VRGMGWTVIYSTLENGVESFTMTSTHDGPSAWTDAEQKLTARLGPDCSFSLYAIVKGVNPMFTKAA